MKMILISLLTLVMALKTGQANVGTGENIAEYNAVCELIMLAIASPKAPELANAAEADYNKLMKLNMTLAPSWWIDMFFKNGDKQYPHNDPKAAGINHNNWDGMWPKWLQLATELKTETKNAAAEEFNLHKVSDTQRQAAAALIRPIAARAHKIFMSIPADVADPGKLAPDAISKTLNTAAFGEDALAAGNPKPNKVFAGNVDSTARATLCEIGTGNSKTATALAALACLCHKAHATAQEDVCGQAVTQSATWQSTTAGPTATDLKTLYESCGHTAVTELTSNTLRTAIDRIRRLVKVKSGDGYLGAFKSGCTGANTAGICVKLTGYKAGKEETLKKAPWIDILLQLAGSLAVREQHNAADDQANHLLKLAITEAHEISTSLVSKIQSITTMPAPNSDKTVEQPTKCKSPAESADKCPHSDCVYNITTKECKPKTGAETTART
uniref:Variant surface glycoprotein 1125.1249 n=1 Tax=Trypanosoma brucei TaxID=5691 RepID=A0A1J0R6U6_9TRYP|nr:variant surface glycoprotein 1125.1249 [Trypanosoma brucei]